MSAPSHVERRVQMGRDASRKRGIDADDKAQGKKRERQESCDDGGEQGQIISKMLVVGTGRARTQAPRLNSWLHRAGGREKVRRGREGERERGKEEEKESK